MAVACKLLGLHRDQPVHSLLSESTRVATTLGVACILVSALRQGSKFSCRLLTLQTRPCQTYGARTDDENFVLKVKSKQRFLLRAFVGILLPVQTGRSIDCFCVCDPAEEGLWSYLSRSCVRLHHDTVAYMHWTLAR